MCERREQAPAKVGIAQGQRERGCDQDHEWEVKQLAQLVRAMLSHVQPNFSRADQGHLTLSLLKEIFPSYSGARHCRRSSPKHTPFACISRKSVATTHSIDQGLVSERLTALSATRTEKWRLAPHWWLRKELVEAQPAQYDLYHGGSVARVPGGNGVGKGEDRYFHARWLWASGPVAETEAVRALTG